MIERLFPALLGFVLTIALALAVGWLGARQRWSTPRTAILAGALCVLLQVTLRWVLP